MINLSGKPFTFLMDAGIGLVRQVCFAVFVELREGVFAATFHPFGMINSNYNRIAKVLKCIKVKVSTIITIVKTAKTLVK
jgi:hypothetical protein